MIYLLAVEIENKHCFLINHDRFKKTTDFLGSDSLDEAIKMISTDFRQSGEYTQTMSQLIWWMQTKPKVLGLKSWLHVEQISENKIFQFQSMASNGYGCAIKTEYQDIVKELTVYEYSPVPIEM